MTRLRTFLILLFTLCLSANVNAQFDYDSIALTIGYELEEHYTYNEKDLFSKKFNNEVFLSYVLDEDGESDNQVIKEFADEILKQNYGSLLFDQIQSYINEDSHYNFVNYYIDELKNIYIIFRLFFDDGGVNYHQYLFEPSGIAEYSLTDVFIYLSGEYNSKTLQRILYGMLGDAIKEDGKADKDSPHVDLFIKLGKVNQLRKEGKIDEARSLFFSIPEEQRSSDDFIYIELELIDTNDEKAYRDLMDRMIAKAEAGNPSFYLSTIDYHYLNKDYDKVIEAVDSLYEYTGDEFLEIYKGTAYWEMDKIEEAEKSFLIANEYYPSMTNPYDYLLALYEAEDEKVKFLNTIDTMAKYLYVDLPVMSNMLETEYPAIVATDLYKEWYAKNNKVYTVKKDSLMGIVQGTWKFDSMEMLDGSKMETTEFWEEGYGKVRPSYSFQANGDFSSQLKGEEFEDGFWTVDISNETIDFESVFNKRSKKGKTIIESGYFKVDDKKYYELYSLYLFSIEENTLKLYDPTEGILVYRKED